MAEAPAAPAKPARGRPKDDQAPPKPKNPMQQVHGEARVKIKAEQPELATDLKGMAEALRAAWEKTPQGEKDRLGALYERDMEIWKPKWAAYKETDHYKQFFEVKQDWMDLKIKKKIIKTFVRGKVVVGATVRIGATFEHAYPEGQESKNYKLTMGQKGTVVETGVGEEGKNCMIEWQDGGKKEFLVKKYASKLEDPDIPKRPKSGYMLFAGDVRERAAKEVAAEGGGMGDIGKKISEYWEATPEVKKAEYGERSGRMKEVFDKEFRVYKMSDKYKGFENTKVNLESTQKLKKIQRVTMNDAPKRAPSGFGLWKKQASPKLMEKNKANDITMTMGELGKKLGEMWQDVSQAEKDEFNSKAVALKEQWEQAHLNFKKNNKYMSFLENRQKVKMRQNKLVNLRDMPKRPKSVFALYSAEHKNEVPQGKGEGKGASALKAKFASASEDEKAKLARLAKEAEEQWKKELEDFKAGDQFQSFKTTEDKVKKEFMTEAMKVMTIKFINAAPTQPPKSPFAIYVGEKRKASGDAEGMPKSKEAKREEVLKFKGVWDKLDKEVKTEYEVKMKEKMATWKEEVKTFCEQDLWQEYLKEAKRLKIPIKQILQDKKAAIKRLKNGMRFVPLPEKPETIPQRPPNAYKLFLKAKKQEIDDPEKIVSMWKELDDEGRKPFEDEAKSLEVQFGQDWKDFKASDEGKAYLRGKSSVLRSRKVIHAKFTYLKDMPKKPEGALKTYIESNFKKEKEKDKDAKGFEIRKRLQDRWVAMSPEEKEPLENEAKEKYDAYTEALKEFQAGENFLKYKKAVAGKKKGKKMRKPSGLKPPRAPQEMPKKPRTAIQEFGQEEGNAGKDAAALHEAFNALSEGKRAELESAAKEALKEYEAELFEFNKTEAGQAHQRAFATYERKKKVEDLKAKLAKVTPAAPKKPEGMPEKPISAFSAFCKTKVGGGLDLGGLRKAFAELDQDEKAGLEAKAKEGEAQYQKDLEEFNKTEAGKKYNKAVAVCEKRKRLGEAKVKFLADQPKKPDNAFKFYCNDKHKQAAKDNPDLKGLAVVGKLNSMWREVSDEDKKVYLEKEREAREAYEEAMREFQKSADFKKFKAVESRVSGKPAKAKGKAAPSGPPMPPAPDNLPKKPPMAFFLFKMENRGNPKEVHQKWLDLGAGGQQEWNNKHKEQMDQYEKDLKAFDATADGKKYNRLRRGYEKKLKEQKAKERFLGGDSAPKEPKRPSSAYFLFVNAKRESVAKEIGSSKIADVSSAITKLWNEASKEDKEVYENQAKEKRAEYEEAMKEYKSSDAVKKFDRAVSALNKKPKAKVKKPVKVAKGKAAAGRGRGGAAAGRGRGGGKAASNKSSDSDVMGSDSSNSSSDSDSD